jgi:hypothetical protein
MKHLVDSGHKFPFYTQHEPKARLVMELPIIDGKRTHPYCALAPIGAAEACMIRLTAAWIRKVEVEFLKEQPMEVIYKKWCRTHEGDQILPKLQLPTPKLQERLAETLMNRNVTPYAPPRINHCWPHDKYEEMRKSVEILKRTRDFLTTVQTNANTGSPGGAQPMNNHGQTITINQVGDHKYVHFSETILTKEEIQRAEKAGDDYLRKMDNTNQAPAKYLHIADRKLTTEEIEQAEKKAEWILSN